MNPKENNLKELIRSARKLQKILDTSILKILNELIDICGDIDQKTLENAKEAVLLFIYEETDTNDKKITLEELMRNIRAISKG